MTPTEFATSQCFNEHREPVWIGISSGHMSRTTLGLVSGLDAHLCDKHGRQFQAIFVTNYGPRAGNSNFSQKGDSGAVVVNGLGQRIGYVFAGEFTEQMGEGRNHTTYLTPARWLHKQIMAHYPRADFEADQWPVGA